MQVETLTGEASLPYLPDLAALRIAVFRDWPYLYDGSRAGKRHAEPRYIAKYTAPRSALILARDGERIIGAATCLPLAHEREHVTRPFTEAGLDVSRYFYFGESVLLPEYRGRGIGVKFFAAREAAAAGFDVTTFCAVRRDPTDPRRPRDHKPLNEFWAHRGYTERPELVCKMFWQEVDATEESAHELVFWTKALKP